MEQPKNPYVIGNSVGNSSAFVGRDDVLRDVLSVVRHDDQNAIVLFGQRRIGKTSVLRELEARLSKEGDCLPVFFDLQDHAKQSLGQVLQTLANKISERLPNINSNLASPPEQNFQTWLAKISPEKKLVMLLDEFDAMASSQQQTTKFFTYLRDLLENLDKKRINFVLAVGRNATDLNEIAGSLFKSILSKRVSLLKYEDTVKVIHLAKENNLRWSKEAVKHAWQKTNGHPFITQCLCYTVWNTAYDNEPIQAPEITLEHVDKAIPDTLEKSESAFEWLWGGLAPAERVIASALAGSTGREPITEAQLTSVLQKGVVRVMIPKLQNAPHLLKKWDLIEPIDGKYRFRVELLRLWIVENKPLYEVQKELDNLNPTACKLYENANSLYEEHFEEDALDLLNKVIRINQFHAEAHKLLANILVEKNRFKEACEKLEKLYTFRPFEALNLLIDVLLRLAHQSDCDQEEQCRRYKRILELEPEHQEAQRKLQELSMPREQPHNDDAPTTIPGQSSVLKGMLSELQELEQKQERKERELSENQSPKKQPKKQQTKQQDNHLKDKILTFFKWVFVLGMALVLSYFSYNHFISIPKDTIILEVETDGVSTYSLTGVGSDKPYSFESVIISPVSDNIMAKRATFKYDDQAIELTKNPGTNDYTVSKNLLQQELDKDSHFVFAFLDNARFVFSFEFETIKTNLEFKCQISTPDNKNVPYCKIREKGYLSLFYAIPWWGIGSIIGVLLIFILQLFSGWKHWKKDDKF